MNRKTFVKTTTLGLLGTNLLSLSSVKAGYKPLSEIGEIYHYIQSFIDIGIFNTNEDMIVLVGEATLIKKGGFEFQIPKIMWIPDDETNNKSDFEFIRDHNVKIYSVKNLKFKEMSKEKFLKKFSSKEGDKFIWHRFPETKKNCIANSKK